MVQLDSSPGFLFGSRFKLLYGHNENDRVSPNGEYYGEQVCDKESNFLFPILSASEQQPSLGFGDHGQQKKKAVCERCSPSPRPFGEG